MLECLGQAALRTLLLAAVVQLGLGLLRKTRPQLQVIAWTVVLAASLSMPVLQWATPFRLPVLPNVPGAASIGTTDLPRQASVFQPSTPVLVEDVTTPATALPWLEASYLLVAGVLLLRLAIGIALSLRLVGKAERVRLDWVTDAHIRISRDIAAPVTFANVILLPWDAVQWPTATRDAVLAHERAHIARRDFAMLLASQVNQVVFWFSPLSWWLRRRLAVLAELASDDQAIEATSDRPGYAAVLLEMGRRSGPLLRGLAMARPATLTCRIERILADRVPTTPASRIQQTALVVGAASLSVMAASSHPQSAPPPVLTSTSGQSGLPMFADLPPSGSARQNVPEPAPGRSAQAEVVPQMLPQPVPAILAARPSDVSVVRTTAQPTARATTRSPSAQPLRNMVQPTRAERSPAAHDVPLKPAAVVLVGSASRGNDGHGIATSGGAAGADSQVSSAHQTGRPADEPYCTGIYLPKPGNPRMDGPVDLIQAKYFQDADGTPWLKLSLGLRTQVKLTGLDVERNSVRTTVVTTLPKGTNHMTGTTYGPYGTVDFECIRPNARL